MGFPLVREMHPFISIESSRFLQGDFSDLKCDYTINVPVLWNGEDLPENMVYYPECHTLSTLLYGGNADIAKAFVRLGEPCVRSYTKKLLLASNS